MRSSILSWMKPDESLAGNAVVISFGRSVKATLELLRRN